MRSGKSAHLISIFLRSILAALILTLSGNSVAFAAATALDANTSRQKIAARGIGKQIKVTQANGSQIIGIITGIRADDFDVTAKGSLQPTPIAYANVTALHNEGSSVGRKIGTGAIIGIVAFATLIGIALIAFAAGAR